MNGILVQEVDAPAVRGGRLDRALLLLLVAGAVVRVALWLWFQDLPPRITDEFDYNAIAKNLAERGEFAIEPERPTSLRPPLYPAVVAAIYTAFGIENYQAVRLFQALLSLANVWLLYQLGREVASRQVARWLAGLYCFYPSLLGFNNLILTEVLFTFLLCAFCYVLVLAVRRQSFALVVAAGVMLGLAALTRSVLWLFPPVLVIYLAVFWKGPVVKRLVAAAAVVLAFGVTIAPWAIRNTRLQETFVTIDVMGGRNFMMGNYQHTPMYRSWDAISLQGERHWSYEVKTLHPKWTTQGELDKLALRQGVDFVKQHPGLTLKRDVVKFFDFWGLERELVAGAADGFFGSIPKPAVGLLAFLILASYAAALFAGLFGMFLAPPEDRAAHWLFLLVLAFVCGIHALVFAHSRYHLPVMPLILLYAASAVVNRGKIWQRRQTWSFRFAATACVVFVAGWTWLFLAADSERLQRMLNLAT